MRVFNIYRFNIADRVKFKDTQPYLKTMLAELGLNWSDLAFSVENISSDTVISKVLEKFPELKKYYHATENGPIVCSYTENWFSGELFANKSDYDDVFTLFSKIPRPFNIPFGHILLNGVNWFSEETAAPAPDPHWEGADFSKLANVHYYSNYIAQHRNFDDGLKYNGISVCIETTCDPEPRDSSAIIEKLIPYLGKPVSSGTKCVFSREEYKRYNELLEEHSEYIHNYLRNALPDAQKYPFSSYYPAPIPHLADIPTMKKAFAGTDFTHKKGNPGWLGEYDCRDSHGHLYSAYIQKLSDGCTFRVWLEISGYNFRTRPLAELDYSMREEGESMPILREFALLCAKIRDEYGDKLAADFGDTPEWYYRY
ncbi:MAG: hypothetical protein NC092_06980 [Butyrivibrio sp.]|nr:hypothetical protein [Muribaculum sp.]MCM1552419.1 hypothetical protein [Butyrivibrio sp.]